MTAEIKKYSLLDSEQESEHLFLEFEIGPRNISGSNIFSLEVCTPTWIMSNVNGHGRLFEKALFVSESMNIKEIANVISNRLTRVEGSTWDELSEKISRFLNWEFDNYRM